MRAWTSVSVAACLLLVLGSLATARAIDPDKGLGKIPPDFSDGTHCRQVTGDGVRIRTGPCTDETILAQVNKGDKVHYTGRQRYDNCGHSWSQVLYKGKKAWIAVEFLTYCPGRTCTESGNSCNLKVTGAKSNCCSNVCTTKSVSELVQGTCK